MLLSLPSRVGWILLWCLFSLAGQRSAVANPQEISDLYGKADAQMQRYITELAQLDARFQKTLLRKGYHTKVFNTDMQYVYERFQFNQRQVTEAAAKHRENATKMGAIPRWVDQMRRWADVNTQHAIRYTWQAKMEWVKAEIAAIYTQAKRESQRRYQHITTERERFEGSLGRDYQAVDAAMSEVYATVAQGEELAVARYLAHYQRIAAQFTDARRRLVEDTWRWYHYHADRHFDVRAKAYKQTVYKRFAYDLDERPKAFLIELFGDAAFADSDMDFFMNMPGTEDRFLMYLHALKQVDTFYKLNGYVASQPVELFDNADYLPPIRFSGSLLERMAKTLAARQKSYYRTKQQIHGLVERLQVATHTAEELSALINSAQDTSQRLMGFIDSVEIHSTLSEQIEAAEQGVSEAQDDVDTGRNRLALAKQEVARLGTQQGARVIRDFRNNQYRLASAGETGKDKHRELASLDRRIALLDAQLTSTDAASDTQQRVLHRLQVLRQERRQLSELMSPDEAQAQRAEDEAKTQLRIAEDRLESARETLLAIRGQQVNASVGAMNKGFWKHHQAYRTLYEAAKVHPLLSPKVASSLIPPTEHRVLNDVIAQSEILAGYQRSLRDCLPILREQVLNAKHGVNVLLGDLVRKDKRLSQYAKAVALKKAQASSLVIYVAEQAGASNQDPVIQFMKAFREAASITEKYLSPEALLGDVLGASEEEKQLLSTGNTVVQWFAKDSIDAAVLDDFMEKVAVARRASGVVASVASKGQIVGETLEGLRSGKQANLANSLSYFATITEFGKWASDGVPVVGDVFGVYMDYMAYAVKSIRTQALSIQDRVFSNTEKYVVEVAPEHHLYTMAEIASEMPTVNFSDRDRVLRVYQIRRLVALMQAQGFRDVCDRPLGQSQRCI